MVTSRGITIYPPEPPELWLQEAPAAPHAALTALIVGAYNPPEHEGPDAKTTFDAAYCEIIGNLARSHEKLSTAYRTEGYDPKEDQLYRAAQRALECQKLEKEPTYRLEELWPYFQARDGYPPLRDPQRLNRLEELDQPAVWFGVLGSEFAPISPFLGYLVFRSISGIQPELTVAWGFKRRVFAVGKHAPLVQNALGGHHKIESPPALLGLVSELRELNPWRARMLRTEGDPPSAVRWHSTGHERDRYLEDMVESPRFAALRARLSFEFGIDLMGAVESWRAREDPELGKELPRSDQPPRIDSFRQMAAEAHARAMQLLTEVSLREFEGPLSAASVVFRIERASASPMLVLPKQDRDEFHVLADLSGGRMLRIRARRFKEDPGPMRIVRDYPGVVVDGGDLRLWMHSIFDENLEGPDNRGRRRREEATRTR